MAGPDQVTNKPGQLDITGDPVAAGVYDALTKGIVVADARIAAAKAGIPDATVAVAAPPKTEETVGGEKITPTDTEKALADARENEKKAKEEVVKAEAAKKEEDQKQLKIKQRAEAQAAMKTATDTMVRLQDGLEKNPNDPTLKEQLKAAQVQLDAAKKTLGDLGSDSTEGGIGQTLKDAWGKMKGGNLASGALFAFLGYVLAGFFGEGPIGMFASIALPIAMFFMGTQNDTMGDFFSGLVGGPKKTAAAPGQTQTVDGNGQEQAKPAPEKTAARVEKTVPRGTAFTQDDMQAMLAKINPEIDRDDRFRFSPKNGVVTIGAVSRTDGNEYGVYNTAYLQAALAECGTAGIVFNPDQSGQGVIPACTRKVAAAPNIAGQSRS